MVRLLVACVVLLGALVAGIFLFPLERLPKSVALGSCHLKNLSGSLHHGEADFLWQVQPSKLVAVGHWHWQLDWTGFQLPGGILESSSAPVRGRLRVEYAQEKWRFDEVDLHADLADLQGVLPIVAVSGLIGEVHLNASTLTLGSDRFIGEATLESPRLKMRGVPVPLGTYRAHLVFANTEPYFTLTTLEGPLHAEGRGRFDFDGHVGFNGRLWLEAHAKKEMVDLFSLMGRPTDRGEVMVKLPYRAD